MLKAWEVDDGVGAIYCETLEDAQMVALAWSRRLGAIGVSARVKIEECTIREMPESYRKYIARLRSKEVDE